MFEEAKPLIIIGMHRSGTSVFAKTLHDSGVFMGSHRSVHDEAYFFLRRNQWLFQLSGAKWDNPKPIRYLFEGDGVREEAVERLQSDLQKKIRPFLGWRRYLSKGKIEHLVEPWGWKDPRSTFTLPIWLDLFPNARVVNMVRNAPDVAGSLWRREQTRANRLDHWMSSCRCTRLNQAFEVWAEYVENSMRLAESLPEDRVLHLRFEDFVQDPAGHVTRVAKLLGCSLDPARVKKACPKVRQEPGYRFLKDETLMGLYREIEDHPLMRRFDYHGMAPSSE